MFHQVMHDIVPIPATLITSLADIKNVADISGRYEEKAMTVNREVEVLRDIIVVMADM